MLLSLGGTSQCTTPHANMVQFINNLGTAFSSSQNFTWNNSTQVLTIAGSASISTNFEIGGIASASQYFVLNNTSSASFTFNSNGSGGTNQSKFSIGESVGRERLSIFGNSNNDLLTIASTGNVGIGTNNPLAKLHLGGTGQAVTNNYGLLIDDKTVGTKTNYNIWSGPSSASFNADLGPADWNFFNSSRNIITNQGTITNSNSYGFTSIMQADNQQQSIGATAGVFVAATNGSVVGSANGPVALQTVGINYSTVGQSVVQGANINAYQAGSGGISDITGIIINLQGYKPAGFVGSLGAISNAYDIHLGGDSFDTGAPTNLYGILIDNQTAGTNNWAIKTGLGRVSFGDSASISSNLELTGAGRFASSSYFYAQPGTAALPAFSFGNDTDTGLWHPATNILGLSAGGTAIASISATGFEIFGYASASTFYTQSGTALLPSFTFNNDSNTGIFNKTADSISITAGGVEQLNLTATTASISNALYIDSGNNIGIGTTGPDTLLHVFKGSAGAVTAATNSLLTLENSTHAYLNFLVPAGSGVGFKVGQGTNNELTSFTYNNYVANSWAIQETRVGSAVSFVFNNLDNTNALSGATFQVKVGGASAGDPYSTYVVSGVTNWSTGVDNSDGDKFKIGYGATPSAAGNVMTMDTAGNVSIGTTTITNGSILTLASASARLTITPSVVTQTGSASIDFIGNGVTANNEGKFTIKAGGLAGLASEQFRILNGNGTSLLTIASTGNVGIGTTAPKALFEVRGTASASKAFFSNLTVAAGTPSSVCMNAATKEVTVNAALTCTVSARDQKTKIADFFGSSELLGSVPSALDLVMKLNPTQFAYKDFPNRMRWGFIADEVQKVDPKLGDAYVNGKARSLDENALIALNTKAIQELNVKIKNKPLGGVDDTEASLEVRIASLEARITALENQHNIVYKIFNWFINLLKGGKT